MQDRYAGDTPDFGKYLLLRHIQKETKLQLGVNWYRTRPEEVDRKDNSDGETRHHARLPHEFENAAPEIYRKLRLFEEDNHRCIENLENAGVFLNDTIFFNQFISFGKPRSQDAPQIRRDWFDRALEKLKDCQVVFLDPDTGPAPSSMLRKAHTKSGPKYAYPEEIAAHLNAGQSVIVVRFIRQYRGGIEKAVRDTFEFLEEHESIRNRGFAIEFPSGRNSTYFFLPLPDHEDALCRAIGDLMNREAGRLYKQHSGYFRSP